MKTIRIADNFEKKFQIGSVVMDGETKIKYLIISAINDDLELGKKIQEVCRKAEEVRNNISLAACK